MDTKFVSAINYSKLTAEYRKCNIHLERWYLIEYKMIDEINKTNYKSVEEVDIDISKLKALRYSIEKMQTSITCLHAICHGFPSCAN
jgi:hypothetical protein